MHIGKIKEEEYEIIKRIAIGNEKMEKIEEHKRKEGQGETG